MEIMKKRTEDYYRTLCNKVVVKRSFDLAEFIELVDTVDKIFNAKPVAGGTTYGYVKQLEYVKSILGNYIEVSKVSTGNYKGLRVDYQTKVDDQLSIEMANGLVTKRYSTFVKENSSQTKQGKIKRDVIVKVAKDLESDTTDRATAIRKAESKVSVNNSKLLAYANSILELLRVGRGSRAVSGNQVKEIFKQVGEDINNKSSFESVLDAINANNSLGIDFKDFLKLVQNPLSPDMWSVEVNRPGAIYTKVEEMCQKLSKEFKPAKKVTSGDFDTPFRIDSGYVAFVIGGYLKLSGNQVCVNDIREVLNNNTFINMGISTVEVVEVVKKYSEFFDYNTSLQTISFKENNSWLKVDRKYNPSYQKLDSFWVINSGLSNKDIEEILHLDTVEEVGVGKCQSTKIFKVSTGRGFTDIQRLAKLYNKLRLTRDFVLDKDLERKLTAELNRQQQALEFAYSIVDGDSCYRYLSMKDSIKADGVLKQIEVISEGE